MRIMKGEVQFEEREISISATVLLVTIHNQGKLSIPTATVDTLAKEAIGCTLSIVHSIIVVVAAFIAIIMM